MPDMPNDAAAPVGKVGRRVGFIISLTAVLFGIAILFGLAPGKENSMSNHEPKRMTSRQGDIFMWVCIALALFVTIALPLLMD